MKRYRFLEEADDEFQEQIRYFDATSTNRGDKFIDEVADAVRDIREYPLVGALLYRKVRKRALHSFPFNVFYVDRPEEVVIVAVAPHKRRPDIGAND